MQNVLVDPERLPILFLSHSQIRKRALYGDSLCPYNYALATAIPDCNNKWFRFTASFRWMLMQGSVGISAGLPTFITNLTNPFA